ncbi:MAG: aminomethyl-transferring glycine dehydrogenase subunit GcvPA [Armatimonadetes bacterium]|nr:aminomethyl-transferring glycine dehydrogenase subunit GcvPA [Armatimonadota bacterium]MDW8122103.1 aminomethyl-transferring glycine dehydrogenase subunit GcvPA [Armatimonadota bacterium]
MRENSLPNLPYLPVTAGDQEQMLKEIGVESVEDLFADIPESLRQKASLPLPEPLSEPDLIRHIKALAQANRPATGSQGSGSEGLVCFLGAGIYDHYVPATVPYILSRGEFVTAYTPYQAEASQGTLHATFEYQSLICDLTEMEVSNASVYDGASALAEGILMAHHHTNRNRILIPRTLNPFWASVARTYASGLDLEWQEIPFDQKQGTCDLDFIRQHCDDRTACVVVQHPNFFGCLEPVKEIESITHSKGALLIVAFHPISLGLIKPPGALGADIAVAEGQSLGLPMSFGGPLLGIFTCKRDLIRKMPGRLVGATVDARGQRGFVLTLQVREQHIRRERATSNICTNQALCALAAAVYLATLGKDGIRKVATLCAQKAHYLSQQLRNLDLSLRFSAPFFNEFTVDLPCHPDEIHQSLLQQGFLGGLPLNRFYPELPNGWLLAVTEKRTKEEIDRFCEVLGQVINSPSS